MGEIIKDGRLFKDMRVEDLIELYGSIHGFMASHIYEAIKIIKEFRDKCETRILSFTGNIIATGLRGVISQLLRERLFNVVITTCGAVDHDIARSFGGRYMKGFFDSDDIQLHREGMHRLGNIFIPVKDYGPIVEKVVHSVLRELVSRDGAGKSYSVRDIVWEIGRRVDDENSVLRAAVSSGTPVYVPGFLDGAFGTALFTFSQFNRISIDVFRDESELADIAFRAKCMGALIIGGGISKHHTLWWAQFHGGLDYAVYVTTAVEWDGSLSGARPREAVTWSKIREGARSVVVYGDATVIIPIIAYGVLYT
ncbi:MAG: deoxyhypusine synthase [Ignisphaera sp.]|nr:deoxyhypusine synthase [Ignisphaera sp.]